MPIWASTFLTPSNRLVFALIQVEIRDEDPWLSFPVARIICAIPISFKDSLILVLL